MPEAKRLTACLSLAGMVATMIWAQGYTGSLTGIITDPSEAVVPRAKVAVTDMNKGYSFKGQSDASGNYLLRSLPPGTYRFSASAPGFKTYVQEGIVLDVGQHATLNCTLQLGTPTQSVQVTGAPPLLDAHDAVTGQIVNRKFINDLPLVGRVITNLTFLTPGVTEIDAACPIGTPLCPTNNFVSNGTRNATSDLLMDGVTTTNYETNSGIQIPTYIPSMDAVDEFAVQDSSFSAEYGFTGSTIVNMITRSGTNKFHGSGYDYLRNQVMDANNFFNNAAGIPIPALKLNNFGATLGGPIKHDRTFFFFDYDGTRQRSLASFQSGVPSAAERQGDFGELCGYAGGVFDSTGRCSAAVGQLWDPYTGVYDASRGGPVRTGYIPFNNLATYMSPGNPKLNGTSFQLPAKPGNLIDPIAYKMMQFFPLPNLNVGTAAYDPYSNWAGSSALATNNDQFDVKIDHRFSDRDLLSAKYSQQRNNTPPINCYGNAGDPCDSGPLDLTAHLVAINHTHTFSPTVLLNLSYGLTRGGLYQGGIGGDASYKDLSPSNTLGLPAYMNVSGIRQLPSIVLPNYLSPSLPTFGGTNLGSQTYSYAKEGQETHQLLGTLSWHKGRHDLKFGAEGRMHRMNFTASTVPGGYFRFDFTSTSEFPFSGGGDDLASFLTGVGGPGAAGSYGISNWVSTQNFQAGGFVQDNWKLGPKLTLNLGFRYDVTTPRTERYNRMNEVSTTVVSPVQVSSLATLQGGLIFMSPDNRYNYNIDFHNLGPRAGLAYQPFSRTVIRVGYGIFYLPSRSGAAKGRGYDGYSQSTGWQPAYQNDGATPGARFSDPFPPNGPKLPPGSSLGLLQDVGFAAQAPIPSRDSLTPYEQTWSFSIQRELPSSILLDASYLGKKGTHLYFGGADSINYLGPEILQYSADQITALNTKVSNPFYGVITDRNSSLASPKVSAYQLQRPFPQFTNLLGDSPPWANSIYNALQLKVEKRFSRGLQFLVSYTWSKSIDDASATSSNVTWIGGATDNIQDPNNRRLERSLSTFDIPSVLQFSYTYELPIGRGKALDVGRNRLLNAVVGGWQTNGIWRFSDGRSIMLGLSGGQSLPTYGGQRPNLTGPLACNDGPDFLTHYFANPGVAVKPAPFTLGNAPRTIGSCRQPGQANANLSIFKEFSLAKVREGARMQFRFETYNAFNHPQFSGPGTRVRSGSFGVINSTANSPREVQVALKVYW